MSSSPKLNVISILIKKRILKSERALMYINFASGLVCTKVQLVCTNQVQFVQYYNTYPDCPKQTFRHCTETSSFPTAVGVAGFQSPSLMWNWLYS